MMVLAVRPANVPSSLFSEDDIVRLGPYVADSHRTRRKFEAAQAKMVYSCGTCAHIAALACWQHCRKRLFQTALAYRDWLRLLLHPPIIQACSVRVPSPAGTFLSPSWMQQHSSLSSWLADHARSQQALLGSTYVFVAMARAL
jgi:hypothetical protein